MSTHAELGTAVHIPMLKESTLNFNRPLFWDDFRLSIERNNNSLSTLIMKLKETIQRMWNTPMKQWV
jgi:hypothetical protein